jgi:hypothetical protein
LRPVAAALAVSLVGHTNAAASTTGELPGDGATVGSGCGTTPTGVGVGVGTAGTEVPPPLPPPQALMEMTPMQSHVSFRKNGKLSASDPLVRIVPILKHRPLRIMRDGADIRTGRAAPALARRR